MRTLSLFQILPSHVVELIVGHVAGSSRLLFDGVTHGSEAYSVLSMPLLSVCRDFRAVVLARYCKIHSLDLSFFSDQGNDKMILWPERLRGIRFPTHLYARELDITFGTFSVYNGTVLKELLSEPYRDILCPMVRSLKVTLTQTTKEQRLLASSPSAQDIETNICAFVQRIRLMAPATRKVRILLESRSDNESQFVVQHFSSLVAQLSQLGNTIEHNYTCNPIRLEPPPTGICSLVHVDWTEENVDIMMQLARHNAATLQTLRLYMGETYYIGQLIQNVDGSYVQFPYLTSLRLERWLGWERGETEQETPPVFPSATPFPKLRHLSFTSGYPFGDDTPFRGNTGTLEYVRLCISSGVLRVLKERQVFTHNSHPKLQCVRLELSSFRPLELIDSEISCIQFALSIGSNARVRKVDHWPSPLPRQHVIPLLCEYTCIQVLLLPFISMDLWGTIALVKALPLLTDLHIGTARIGSLPRGVHKHMLPAYVIANYAPIGERFRCLQLELHDKQFKVSVKCMLLLALVCPNFDYTAIPVDRRELFMAHMKKTISSNGYRQHAARLRRLLFGGWKDEIPSSPEEIQQWQQQWDRLTVEKEALLKRRQQYHEQQQEQAQQKREAKLVRRQKHEEMMKQHREASQKRMQEECEARMAMKRRRELELERKKQVRLQRRQTMIERRQQVPELALSCDKPMAPSPNSVLQMVFGYLSPVPGPACTSKELLVHLRSLQRVAAVNREWRAVALPLFYHTAYVVIGGSLDIRDVDDDGKSVDTKGRGVKGDDSMGIGNKGQGETDVVDEGDDWNSDDDDDLLNPVGLSRSGIDIRLRTNIGLLSAAGLIEKASEVQIIVQGKGQTAGQLLRQLLLAEFGRHMWPAVELLRIDMRDSSGTTQTNTEAELLSDILPSLRKIEYYGSHSKAIYGCVLIEQLIKERLNRPELLCAVRVKADCWPKLTDDYDTGVTALPIFIDSMEIDGPDETYLMPAPIMIADTLVELKLAPVIEEFEWNLLEYLGDMDSTEGGSVSSKSLISFSSLKTLVLKAMNIEHVLEYRFEGREDEEESEEGTLYYDDVQSQLCTRFRDLPEYDTPKFPVLSSLELRDSIHYWSLSMFADSPITSLVLCCSACSFQSDFDLSIFRGLRSLSLRFTSTISKDDTARVSKALSTVCPSLKHLTLALTVGKSLRLLFPRLPFADSLTLLTLEGEHRQHDVEYMLRLFPNLRRLSVCVIFSEPIFSDSRLIDEYQCANAAKTLPPLNTSLRVLEAYGKRYFSDYYRRNSTPKSKRLMAPELNHYRGMIVSLVCRLPALDMLRVGAQSVDGVTKGIGAIVSTNVGLEYIGCLQRLRVQSLEY
ncbi:hypothetical protein H4S04_000644 [Coemansia sp. S16]|nr:hypothetical protein H4S04_000644 [Coemansia sp. S16]